MIKKIMGTFLISLLTFCGVSAHAQVEQVTTLRVTDPGGMIATIDQYQMDNQHKANSVSLLAHMHDGVDPATHTVVGIYDDLDAMERALEGRIGSAAWATLLRSASGISQATSSALAIQKRTWGDDAWEEGGYLAAVLVNASNSAEWLDAMDAWNRSNKVRNPGMIRIVKLRGAPANHAVLIAGSDYADVINFMEGVEASDEFATLQGAVEVQIVGSTYYRVVKVWIP
ncbi:MAG: hypothetical protein ACR2Q3_15125 [Woeseiaceae bacterium]